MDLFSNSIQTAFQGINIEQPKYYGEGKAADFYGSVWGGVLNSYAAIQMGLGGTGMNTYFAPEYRQCIDDEHNLIEILLDAAFQSVLDNEIEDFGVYSSTLHDFEGILLRDCRTNSGELDQIIMQVTAFFDEAAKSQQSWYDEPYEEAMSRTIRQQLEGTPSVAYRALREAAEEWVLNKQVEKAAWHYGQYLAIAVTGMIDTTCDPSSGQCLYY